LGLSEFDEDIFTAKIKQIVVPFKNRLVYHFHNGKTVTREWKSTAHADSWTPERRAAQSARQTGKTASEEHRKAQSEGMKAYYIKHPERRRADSERMKKLSAESSKLSNHKAASMAEKTYREGEETQ
jgi:hypothetical protein